MGATIEHILVATDLSDNARHAFDYAAMLAQRLDSRLTVLYVIETLSASARLLVSDMVGESRLKSLEKEKQEQVLAAAVQRNASHP